MKRLVLISIALALFLTACSSGTSDVVLDGVTYKTGFYGDLFVNDLERSEYAVIENENNFYKNFYRVENTDDDLLITYPGGVNGELYCQEDEWEEKKAYYDNPDNFVYYCGIKYGKPEAISVDIEKFNALKEFEKANSYVPFATIHNKGVEIHRVPMFDSPEYVFYKESKDGLFTSSKGYEFLILDGRLVMLFYYDHNHGENGECVYVDVPEDLSEYFMTFVEDLD